jgi:hypothetical protein
MPEFSDSYLGLGFRVHQQMRVQEMVRYMG